MIFKNIALLENEISTSENNSSEDDGMFDKYRNDSSSLLFIVKYQHKQIQKYKNHVEVVKKVILWQNISPFSFTWICCY